jgi:uncharacterized protein (DUF983 family)
MVPVFIESNASAPMWVKLVAVVLLIVVVVSVVFDSRH